MKYCFGVDIGGTSVKLGLFDMDGTLLAKWEIRTRTDNCGQSILPNIADTILKHMDTLSISREEVTAIGVGVPAPVYQNGICGEAVNLGWQQKDVKQELEALTGRCVYVQNDANLAALGEMWKGAGTGCSNLIMVTLGTGVGGGVVMDGRLISGANGGAGEIGELIAEYEVQSDGSILPRNLEYYASATGIVRLAEKKLAANTRETGLVPGNVTAKAVFDSAKQGDAVAEEVLNDVAHYLGKALTDLAVVLDPEVLVIGGGVSKAGDILLRYVEKCSHIRSCKLVLASLGNDAGIYGAARFALSQGSL